MATTTVSQEIHHDFVELIQKLTAAIMKREYVSSLSVLNTISSRTWCRMLNSFGDTLLQASIIYDNKEAFDFLLPFHDVIDLETQNSKRQTALFLAIKCCRYDVQNREHYTVELINKGAYIHTVCDINKEPYLHLAVRSSSLKILRLLLEKGVDVNAQNRSGDTALHKIVTCNDEQFNVEEIVAILMYYNVDPLIANDKGYIPFEYAIRNDHKFVLIESLFFYTFDEYTNHGINKDTAVRLAKSKSPLFQEILKYDCFLYFDTFNSLLDLDNWDILTRKRNYNRITVSLIDEEVDIERYDLLTSKKGINNLNILLDNEIKLQIASFLASLESYDVFKTAFEHNNEEVATEILTYLLSHGLCFGDSDYHLVYESFGYCDLLKLMLHIGLRMPRRRAAYSIMPLFLYDVHMNLEAFFHLSQLGQTESSWIQRNANDLLDCFAHPKLADFLMKYAGEGTFPETILARIRQHPKVPLLLEMARNVCRKHLIKEFEISSTCQFYTVVNRLPLCETYKKIITYETKLYY